MNEARLNTLETWEVAASEISELLEIMQVCDKCFLDGVVLANYFSVYHLYSSVVLILNVF